MADEDNNDKDQEKTEGEKKKSFSGRVILIYALLLTSGLFLGIVFAYFLRQ